ncbi:hypothetical protein [Spiroplasma phoeniceum]|uniref:Uncharacterized protein n=1 Tax=Spiroplasma phoeniceum P40 TaxID=1276259 RepID=A0A345DSN3_9MOLU|nr:hypothetical protein [Spiroplasma phoeniceum]AXF97224.1 hypothetical protein SDAV_003027 [Spiroplasma phoeniceum P40]
MKKLLSILTISTLTASVPVPLLANTTLERTKSDVSTLSSNVNNDYLPIKEINGVNDKVQSIKVDSKDNIYFGTNKGAYKLSDGSDTPTKINGINENIILLVVDSENNIYFGTFAGAYKLSNSANNWVSSSLNNSGGSPLFFRKQCYNHQQESNSLVSHFLIY